MSTHAHDDRGGAHGGHDHGNGEATPKSYLTGFILAALLTAIPFWLVMAGTIDNPAITALIITALAAVQIVVHMVFFLHMNARSEGGWTVMALAFTVIFVVIALAGSLWVMYHLDANMMLAPHEMSQTP
ncbi:MAG: cytochrome o ubiquinol oxidase subunit IV [Hyphomicrobiales bacterium]|nr:cytochrome o ubiquinol oxidase subunit IV [Hyphomicrobiales bacterium]